MKLKEKIYNLGKTVFPSTKTEVVLFMVYLGIYGSLASYIALNYRIVFDNRIPWDAYFSFDNRAIVMTGGGFERHPLSNYFFDWIRKTALLFSVGKMNADFRLFLALCSAFTVSLSLIQIFKYLRNIIRLPVFMSVLLVIFFSAFTTPVLLSFTPETYTYTLFLLVLFNYYAALKLRKDQKIPVAALTLAGVAVGGLTITNITKVYIPVLFEKNLFRSWKKFINAALRVMISVAVFVLLYLYRLNFDWQRIFNKTGEQYDKFSKPKVTPLWDMITSWFWGGNMLFPSFVIRDYHNKKGFEYKALFMDVYSAPVSYAFIAVVFVFVMWAIVRNYKNKFVQILALSFLFDIFIHCVLKFGLHTSYIYGGHFIFVVPLLLGWLFYGFRKSAKMQSFLTVSILVLTIFLLVNNVWRMQEFFYFLKTYYK